MGFSRQEYWSGVPLPSPMYTLPYVKHSGMLLYSRGSSARCSMITERGGMGFERKLKREGIYVYIWLIHIVVQEKLTHHCKVIILNQIRSVAQSCPTLFDPMNRSTPGLPVHHQLPEFTQTHVHRVSDAIQPSHPLSSPSPRVPNPSQHQSLFQ